MLALLALPLLLNGDGPLNPGAPLPAPAGWCADILGDGRIVDVEDGLISYYLHESAAGWDGNGDGDMADTIHAIRFGENAPIVTNLAGRFSWVAHDPTDGSPWAVVGVWEPMQGGLDLNGDGDANDLVLVLVDALTGETFESGVGIPGLSITSGPVAAPIFGSAGFVLRRSESSESFGSLFTEFVDLNGDGDASDKVYYAWNRTAGVARVVAEGWAPGERLLAGDRGLLVSSESQTQVDHNGDGDVLDLALTVYDFASDEVVTLPYAVRRLEVSIGDGLDLFQVSEGAQGAVDLNGDGDTEDEILHLLDPATGQALSLGFATGKKGAGQFDGDSLVQSGGVTAIVVHEDGSDLNGDGDGEDAVLYLLDTLFGSFAAPAFEPTGRFEVTPEYVFFDVLEAPAEDLNGDGTSGGPASVAYARANGDLVVVPYVLGLGVFHAEGGMVALGRSEASEDLDIDGDGDIAGSVLITFDLVSHVETVVTQFTGFFRLVSGDVFSEFREFVAQEDVNLDGDTFDRFVQFDDLASGAHLKLPWNSARIVAGTANTVLVSTFETPLEDLNGDGDHSDGEILVVLRRE